jgi:uncharacterized RDD family membrane protein YckC
MPRIPVERAPASLLRRAGAYLLDSLIFTALAWGLTWPLMPWLETWDATAVEVLNSLVYAGVVGALCFEMTRRWGSSPGKWLFQIWIVDSETGGLPDRKKSALRIVGYVVAMATLGVGYLMILWDRKRRCLQDRIAGTEVVQQAGSWLGQ